MKIPQPVTNYFDEEHWIITSVLLWCGWICFSVVLYLLCGITLTVAGILGVAAAGALCFILTRIVASPHQRVAALPNDLPSRLLFACALIADFTALYTAWNVRMDGALTSPWELLHRDFFILIFVATLLHVVVAARARAINTTQLFALVAHFFLMYGMCATVFRYGFGFDPLIHQAAEQYIALHSKIFPVQPFYLGQYTVVVVTHLITHAPLILIDRFFLPLLAAISIPPLAVLSFRRGWNLSVRASFFGTLGLLIIPISEFTFTVPHNISTLYLLWWILILPLPFVCNISIGLFNSRILTLYGIACAATVTHPLLGAPLVLASALMHIYKIFSVHIKTRAREIFLVLLSGATIGATTLAEFAVYRMRAGLSPLAFESLHAGLARFFWVFSWHYGVPNVSPVWQLAYGCNFVLPWLVIGYGLWFLWSRRITAPPAIRIGYTTLLTGLFFSILSVSLFIYLPGIVSYEQNEFLLRIKSVLPIIMIVPCILFFIEREARASKIIRAFYYFGFAFIICSSFYFSYPSALGVTRPGWNVSAQDIFAIEFMRGTAAGKQFIGIGNQILAATGLRTLGFDARVNDASGASMFPFAIGPDEPLYPLTQKVLYEKLDAVEIHNLARKINGVVFVVVHDYWFRAEDLNDEALAASPTSHIRLSGLTIYEFQ